jgi:hypothetical protein
MAAGDAYIKLPASVADTAHMDLTAGSGAEIVVHNIYVPEGTAVELYQYDGTDTIKWMSTNTSLLNLQLHCTNTEYIRVKNVSGSAAIMAADGMFTK